MTILSIHDHRAVDLAIREIHRRPILVQLPTVFGLLAAPTSQGAAQLDQLKSRLPGKTYGTLTGSYPILGFEKDRVTVHRPGLASFTARIPVHLQSWQ